MGLSWSKEHVQPTKVVLVPPLFQRDGVDARQRDHFASSPYPYYMREVSGLFQDYLSPLPSCCVLFSPPADKRLTVAALVGLKQSQMVLRYQPLGVRNPHTFVDWQGDSKKPGDTVLRASLFDPDSGLGVFGSLPCAKRISGALAQVGIRYSSPSFTAGAIMRPRTGELAVAWLAGRYAGLLGVVEWEPNASLASMCSKMSLLDETSVGGILRQQSKVALAYEPVFNTPAGQGRFSARIEFRNGRHIAVSFYQHMAVSRQVFNPIEAKDVVGITNYIDLGMEIILPTAHEETSHVKEAQRSSANMSPLKKPSEGRHTLTRTSRACAAGQRDPSKVPCAEGRQGDVQAEEAGSVNLAAAWQLNKNWLVKARVGSESVAAALAVRNWQTMSIMATMNISWRYGEQRPRLGAHVQLENFGNLRYERGISEATGRAVLQRHEAGAQDLANALGHGRQVIKGTLQADYDFQPQDTARDYL